MLTAAKGEVIKTIWRRMGSCVVQLCRVSRHRRRRGAAFIPKDSQANLSPKSYISRLLKERSQGIDSRSQVLTGEARTADVVAITDVTAVDWPSREREAIPKAPFLSYFLALAGDEWEETSCS